MSELTKDIALRPAGPDDRVFLWQVHRQSMREQAERHRAWDDDEQLQLFLAGLDLSVTKIITVSGRDVGLLITIEDEQEIFLRQISLLPAHQKRGTGTRVVRSLLQRAQATGRSVRLQVLKGNPAQRLYERLGFAVFEQTETHLRMRWRLAGRPRR
jgi:ribosomal protein S18 acetylase RimI-like enzyme